MNHVSRKDIEWESGKSPKGGFEASCLDYAAPMEAGDAGHPFEIMFLRIPPGRRPWPYHSHATQWELYYVMEGAGEMRLDGGTASLQAGDAMMCPPDEAHQLHNTGESDLLVLIIADNPPVDVCHYPDSGKWQHRGTSFRMDVTNYYDGEE